MKLNLGCGSDLLHDYLNVDIHKPKRSKSNEPIENFEFYQSSIEDLSWIEDSSVSEIRAKDIIDHIHWKNIEKTLLEWNRVLQEGGKLLLYNIPDFERSFNKYFKGKRNKKDWEAIQHWIDMLSFEEERFRSKNLIDLPYLEKLLESSGFLIIESRHEKEELYLKCMKGKMKNLIDYYLENIEIRIRLIKECYLIRHYLVREHEETKQVVTVYNNYIEFFHTIEESIFITIITRLSTLFDNDKRSISFPNLIKIIKQCNQSNFKSSFNYDEFYNKGRRIWNYRCKDVAHVDRGTLVTDFLEEANFNYDEFENFIDDCGTLINELYEFWKKPMRNIISEKSGIKKLIADLSNINKNNT